MKRHWILMIAAAALSAPWIMLFKRAPTTTINWSCQSTVEINKMSPEGVFRTFAKINNFYHADGTGVTYFIGTLRQETSEKALVTTSLNRATAFHYRTFNSFVLATTDKTSELMGDNTDDKLAGRYAYKGFTAGYVSHFQYMNMGGGAFAVSHGGMPRVYCRPL